MENFFDYVKIKLASPERIRSWGERTLPSGEIIGEVTDSTTLNYKTLEPEPYGLFCERLFGPTINWTCRCGMYQGSKYDEGIICEFCEVEITKSTVRRKRVGFVSLAEPMSHVWYIKGRPSKIGTLLGLTTKELDDIIYFNASINVNYDHDGTGNLSTRPLRGAEAIFKLLDQLDLQKESAKVRKELPKVDDPKIFQQLIKKLRIIEQFISSGCNPTWMVLTVIPVMPPDLRPLVRLGVRFIISDLNANQFI